MNHHPPPTASSSLSLSAVSGLSPPVVKTRTVRRSQKSNRCQPLLRQRDPPGPVVASYSSSYSSGLRAEAPVFVPGVAVVATTAATSCLLGSCCAPPRTSWTTEGTASPTLPPRRRHRHHHRHKHNHQHNRHNHNHRRPAPGGETPGYDRHCHGHPRNPSRSYPPHSSEGDDYDVTAIAASVTIDTATIDTDNAADDSAAIPTTALWSQKVGCPDCTLSAVPSSSTPPVERIPSAAAVALHPLRYSSRRSGTVSQPTLIDASSGDGIADGSGTDDQPNVHPDPPNRLVRGRSAASAFSNAAALDRWRDRWWDALQSLQDEAHRRKQQQQKQQQLQDRVPIPPVSSLPPSKPLNQTGVNSRADSVVQTLDCCSTSSSEGYVGLSPNVILGTGEDDAVRTWEDAIDRDDAAALHQLVQSRPRNEVPPGLLTRAVQLDRPRLVRALLRTGGGDGDHHASIRFEEAVLLAAELGRDDCLEPLLLRLDHRRSHAWSVRNVGGNSVLHVCFRPSTLRAALVCLDRSASPSQRAKIVHTTNDRGQTPFHRACQLGRDDLVAVWLSHLGNRALSKLWRQRDHAHQTPLLAAVSSGSADTVTTLVLWRSNHLLDDTTNTTSTSIGSGMGASQDSPDSTPCPLAWAVRLRNADMVRLLLEFHDPEASDGHGYNLTEALRLAIAPSDGDQVLRIAGMDDSSVDEHKITDDYDGRLELLQVLVDAGANPCAKSPASTPTAMVLAAHRGDAAALNALLHARDQYLQRVRARRRRDPVLRKQPESFFAGKESLENAEQSTVLREALVTCLVLGYQSNDPSSPFYQCCGALYGKGGRLASLGLARLKSCLAAKSLLEPLQLSMGSLVCRDEVDNYQVPCPLVLQHDKGTPYYWSIVMTQLPWMEGQIDCDCRVLTEVGTPTSFRIPEPDVVLIGNDGARLIAHSSVLSRLDGMLGAALRFAAMSATGASESRGEIQMNGSFKLLKWMLQHMYHGSLLLSECDLRDPSTTANELLDLLLLAEECLCPTLMQECEVRLLSAHPCRCFCASCSKTSGSNNPPSYRSHGPPFFLKQRDATSLDFLSLCQQIRPQSQEDKDRTVEGEYAIDTVWTDRPISIFAEWPKQGNYRRFPPLGALRASAACSILLHWGDIQNSPDVREQMSDDDSNESAGLMLHECLKELKHSLEPTLKLSSGASQTRRKGSWRSSSKKSAAASAISTT